MLKVVLVLITANTIPPVELFDAFFEFQQTAASLSKHSEN